MNNKKHVVLVGMPGSGKSKLGFFLSKLMWMPFVDTDYHISVKEKKSVVRIFEEYGEECFRKMEQQALSEIVERAPSIISTGGGMPCFYNNMDVMNGCAVTVYLEVAPERLFKHLKSGSKRPLVKGKSDKELMDYINVSLEQRKPYYEKADIRLQISGEMPAQLAAELYKRISDFRANMKL
jgi:shikimate kinase